MGARRRTLSAEICSRERPRARISGCKTEDGSSAGPVRSSPSVQHSWSARGLASAGSFHWASRANLGLIFLRSYRRASTIAQRLQDSDSRRGILRGELDNQIEICREAPVSVKNHSNAAHDQVPNLGIVESSKDVGERSLFTSGICDIVIRMSGDAFCPCSLEVFPSIPVRETV